MEFSTLSQITEQFMESIAHRPMDFRQFCYVSYTLSSVFNHSDVLDPLNRLRRFLSSRPRAPVPPNSAAAELPLPPTQPKICQRAAEFYNRRHRICRLWRRGGVAAWRRGGVAWRHISYLEPRWNCLIAKQNNNQKQKLMFNIFV